MFTTRKAAVAVAYVANIHPEIKLGNLDRGGRIEDAVVGSWEGADYEAYEVLTHPRCY